MKLLLEGEVLPRTWTGLPLQGLPRRRIAMLMQPVGMMLLESSDMVEVFRSPFIIPVAGCVMILGMSVASMWAKVRSEEIRSHERLARIAQGLPVEPAGAEEAVRAAASPMGGRPVAAAVTHGQVNDGGKARRAGIVLASIGVGLIGFFAVLSLILQERDVLSGAAVGLVPLAIGIGFLVDARLKQQEYARHMEWERTVGARMDAAWPAAASAATPPPPPPVGMSAAQASDWRPQ